MSFHPPTVTNAGVQYILELFVSGLFGWVLANYGIVGFIDYSLADEYAKYDWYGDFMSVVSLVTTFVMIGLTIALTVHINHPEN